MIKIVERKASQYINANRRRTIQTLKRVRPKCIQNNSINNASGSGRVRKECNLEGFEKLKPKINHRYYFALLNDIEKDIRKDHYTTGQEDLILYDYNGCLVGGF